MTPLDARRRPRVRPGVTVFREPRAWPELTRLGWLVLLAYVLAMAAVAGIGVGLVRAEEEEPARYTPSARGTRAAVVRWRPLLEEYAWDVDTALRVVDCESGGDPEAVNPSSGAAGLFQAMPNWRGLTRRLFGSSDLLAPAVNTALAFVLWEDSGGRFSWHWYASMRCWS